MDFLALQKDLMVLIGDPSPKWQALTTVPGATGTDLMPVINYGVKQVMDRLKHNALFLEQHYSRVTLTITNLSSALPVDYGTDYQVYEGDEQLFNFRIDKKNNTIEFDDSEGAPIPKTIILKYLEKQADLVDATDEPFMDEHFHSAIALYAAEKYHLAQFDVSNAAQSVAYAEDKMEDLTNKYY